MNKMKAVPFMIAYCAAIIYLGSLAMGGWVFVKKRKARKKIEQYHALYIK